MGKVFYDVSMSLDGFISGAIVRPEASLGDGGERLHEWGFNSADPRNRGKHISLEIIEVIQTAEVIHLRFRVVK